MRRLMAEGPAALPRAIDAAGAWVAAHPVDRRTGLWLDVADAIPAQDETSEKVFLQLLLTRANKTSVREERLGLHLAVAERWLSRVGADGKPQEIFDQAERALIAVLRIDAGQSEARARLFHLYERRCLYLEMGRTLGREAVEQARRTASSRNNVVRVRLATEALVQLTEGAERANWLLELVATAGDVPMTDGSVNRVEALYRAALAAEPDNERARQGLQQLATPLAAHDLSLFDDAKPSSSDKLSSLDDAAPSSSDKLPSLDDAAPSSSDKLPSLDEATAPSSADNLPLLDGAESPPADDVVSPGTATSSLDDPTEEPSPGLQKMQEARELVALAT
ncbi:MAG: hypothetical protein AAF449_03880, partial [Myxococcota bacterium]